MTTTSRLIIGGVVIIIITTIIVFLVLDHPHTSQTVATQTSVMFGNPNTCVGAGVCNCVAGLASPPLNSVPVGFSFKADTPSLVYFGFHMNALIQNQLQQSRFFNGSTYTFPNAFAIPEIIVAALGMPQGACILPTSSSVLRRSEGDSVTDAITFSTASTSYVNTMVLFGNNIAQSGGGNVCNNKQPGICALSGMPTSTEPILLNSIPVTFMLKPDNPSILLMSFSFSTLTQEQLSQAGLFKPPVTNPTYTFASTFRFDNPIFANLHLQGASPNIPAGLHNSISVSGDAIIVSIVYSHTAQ